MRFDRGWAYGQSAGDLSVVQSLHHQGQDFKLALRQIKSWRWWLVGCLHQGLRSLP